MKQIYSKPEYCFLFADTQDILTESGLDRSASGIGDFYDCSQW